VAVLTNPYMPSPAITSQIGKVVIRQA
jgi:hypothetical protein